MLIPGRRFTALRAPFTRLIRIRPAVRQKCPAGAACNDLVPIKADYAIIAELPGLYALIFSA